ncbi:hypothetical protein KIY87_gp33 [Mycobacterium phage Malec]|uniref:Uncharacterized protein n=2 Tax=Turbidovirus TaxID=2948936 RepID=A0A0A0RRH8_9CAUD|nr:hypothetical protein PBI_LARENN_67 [Mycobacterium phage Larenn]YP_010064159.1 hypothetical protein KIY87_gp33 [Mycobacterium phage Malec]AIW02962.1 hypothetical protein PBI_LARENN_67 [Mycobacterium phage Larenn]AZV00862.1 hypothetical protein SEA_MALEC_68 [Mycobacterium phage Malec]
MTLYELILAILLRHFQPAEIDAAAEEIHALIIEKYGPPF